MSLAILCPGQGGQHPAMFDIVAGTPEQRRCLRWRIARWVHRRATGHGRHLPQRHRAAARVCRHPLALAHAGARSPQPSLVLGYSVGELAAHAVAGSYSIEDCLRLAHAGPRGWTRRSAGTGLIAILGMNETQIRALCVHSGARSRSSMRRRTMSWAVLPRARRGGRDRPVAGARAVRLKVGAPAHTPWPLARRSRRVRNARLGSKLPYAMPRHARSSRASTATSCATPRTSGKSLAAQIARTVNWSTVIAHAIEMGATVFFELGPGDALARIVREAFPSVEARSLDEFRTLAGAVGRLRRALDKN